MFVDVVKPIVDLVGQFLYPAILLVVSIGALYCVVLGVKYAKAEEQQERQKAKMALKNAIIGFVLIFILILTLNLTWPILLEWVQESAPGAVVQ